MNLIERAKNIILTPKTEWPVIAGESTTTADLYRGYIIPLAAIGPVAQFIGLALIGVSIPFLGSVRIPIVWALSQAITAYVLGLVAVYIISLIIDGLAPSFGGEKNHMQALKSAAYAFTPAWVAGILYVLPVLGILALIAALYSLYVLYLGLGVLMKVPHEKAVGYTAVVVICSIVVMIVAGVVAGAVGGMGMTSGRYGMGGGAPVVADAAASRMAAQMAAAGQQLQASQTSGNAQAQAAAAASVLATAATAASAGTPVEPVDQNVLKALLPDSVGAMARSSVEATKAGVAGMQVSKAEAQYGNGQGSTLDLQVTDMGGANLFGAFAAWAMIEEDKETATGYEKMGKVDGRPAHEMFNKNDQSGDYAVVVAQRFLVEARGTKTDMDSMKKAVAAVDFGKLEAMKNEGVHRTN